MTRGQRRGGDEPPVTAMAMDERNISPRSNCSATGNMPAIMATVVMTMGRARL